MARGGWNVSTRGVRDAIRRAGVVRNELVRALDNETDSASMRVVNEARVNAPRLTGQLANSIDIYEKATMRRVVGSDKPYAQRQEYEHASRKGFFRNALWKERSVFRKNIEKILRSIGR